MKKLLITALLVVGISAFAQDQTDAKPKRDRAGMERITPEQRNAAMVKRMTTQLELSTKQQEQLKVVLAEQAVKRESMRAERKEGAEKPTPEQRTAMREKMMAEQKVMQDKMKSILTPEQAKKWEEMKAKQQEKRGTRMGQTPDVN